MLFLLTRTIRLKPSKYKATREITVSWAIGSVLELPIGIPTVENIAKPIMTAKALSAGMDTYF
jgi:hypothetical protein